ncbi:hypothetical protein O59_002975 [Cellvibrio sp. BR]|nr:hypothetical protein O59_002975 [Cellvibrio sp. BR]
MISDYSLFDFYYSTSNRFTAKQGVDNYAEPSKKTCNQNKDSL